MSPAKPVPYIAVVGAGDTTGELYELAREVGRLVAEKGGTVVCGGLGGVMEAAARGASEAGGMSIGILPDEDRRRASDYLSFSVAAGTGHARNLTVVCSGDVVVAVGGGYGTLSEIGLAKKVGRPVVSIGSWNLGGHVAVAASPEEAVEAAFGLIRV
ncbi:MAG: TIGR00725 family protein [Rubrobacteraceae bacterium]